MITTYLRSSSIGTFDACNHKAFLEYTLGMRSPPTMATEKGNIVHKVMECLANKKKCEQDGKSEFDGEAMGVIKTSDCEPIKLLDMVFSYYTQKSPEICWTQKEYDECKKLVNFALAYQNGLFDPRNLKIITPEQRFDLDIKHDWAIFDYKLPSGKEVSGRLSIKGTIDLLTEISSDTIEITDYKTGSRRDWVTNQTKDFKKLMFDKQLMLYFYAASLLYPNIPNILATIFFIKDGGAYTLAFTKNDIPRIELMLKSSFEDMKAALVPRQNISFRCKFCHFSKPYKDGNTSVCDFMHREVKKNGIGVVTEKYGNGGYASYGEGGGRHEKPNT